MSKEPAEENSETPRLRSFGGNMTLLEPRPTPGPPPALEGPHTQRLTIHIGSLSSCSRSEDIHTIFHHHLQLQALAQGLGPLDLIQSPTVKN